MAGGERAGSGPVALGHGGAGGAPCGQVVLPWHCLPHSHPGTASRLVAFCPCLVFPQTISVWVSCRRGSGKTGIVLSLLSPESEWGGLRVQTGEQVLVLPVAQMACTSSPPGGSLWHRCLWGQQEPPLGRETAQFGLKVEGRAREDQLVWWK